MWLRFCKWVRKAVIRGNPARITSYFCLRFYPGLSIRGLSLGWDLTAGSRYRLDACPSATETQCTASLGTIAASSVQSENVTNESPPRRRRGRRSLPPQYSHIDPRSLTGGGGSAHKPRSKPSFIMLLLYTTAFPITAHFQSGSSSSGGTAGRPLSEGLASSAAVLSGKTLWLSVYSSECWRTLWRRLAAGFLSGQL